MKTRRKLLFALIPLVIVLALCEIVLRTTHLFGAYVSWATPDSNLVYRFIPGDHTWVFAEGGFSASIHVNRYGWVGPEWSTTKPQGNIRIAVLGDSFLEALQVREEDTVLAVAARKLREQFSQGIELMNFGRSGFSQTKQLFVLRTEVTKFSPDIIVSFFFPGNDIADATRRTSPSTLRPFYVLSADGELAFDNSFSQDYAYRSRLLLDPFKRRSVLLSAVVQAYNALSRRESGTALKSGYLSLCTQQPNADFVESYAWTRHLLAEQAAFAQQRGMLFLLVTLNNPAYRSQVAEELRQEAPGFDPLCVERDMREWAGERGVYHLGLQSVFADSYARDGMELHWPVDGHWNPAGNRVAGEALVQQLSIVLQQRLGKGSEREEPLQSLNAH